MTEVLTEFSPSPGRPQVYPWDEWTDGKIRRFKEDHYDENGDFVQGDFNGTVKSFRVLVHKTAKVYGLRATTKTTDDGKGIEVQFHE